MFDARGLSRVATEDLVRLLRLVHRGQIAFPITRGGLIASGFSHLELELDLLVGRDQPGARAVLVAVIGERRAAQRALAR